MSSDGFLEMHRSHRMAHALLGSGQTLLAIGSALLFMSCNQDDSVTPSDEVAIASHASHATSVALNTLVAPLTAAALLPETPGIVDSVFGLGCPLLIQEAMESGYRIRFDFASGCTCRMDGVIRSGEMLIDVRTYPAQSMYKDFVFTFNNYVSDGYTVSGEASAQSIYQDWSKKYILKLWMDIVLQGRARRFHLDGWSDLTTSPVDQTAFVDQFLVSSYGPVMKLTMTAPGMKRSCYTLFPPADGGYVAQHLSCRWPVAGFLRLQGDCGSPLPDLVFIDLGDRTCDDQALVYVMHAEGIPNIDPVAITIDP